MRLVLIGPPGCGKGTQADLLSERLGVPAISSGDLFRSRLRAAATDRLATGALIPDEEAITVVAARLSEPDAADGFVLDGFPRTLPQAQALDGLLDLYGITLDGVLEFQVPSDEVVRRISGRRTCRDCGRIWHREFNPAPNGRCGACDGEIYQRSDDEPATIVRRLDVYAEQTLPVVTYYREADLVTTIDGTGPVDEVLGRVLSTLSSSRR